MLGTRLLTLTLELYCFGGEILEWFQKQSMPLRKKNIAAFFHDEKILTCTQVSKHDLTQVSED